MIRSNKEQAPLDNEPLAAALEEIADLLEAQGANPFRVRAYRVAAGTVRGLKGPVHRILKAEGIAGLMQLPGIGRSLAHAIEHHDFAISRISHKDAKSSGAKSCSRDNPGITAFSDLRA